MRVYDLIFVGFIWSLGLPVLADATSDGGQKKILEAVVSAGCQDRYFTQQGVRDCVSVELSFANTLLNQDEIMFDKNLAGLVVHTCSRFTGEKGTECLRDMIKATGSDNLNDMDKAFKAAFDSEWVYSTKLRRLFFTTRGERDLHYPNNLAYNYFYYQKYNPLFLELLLDYANPQNPNEGYESVLRRNGIDPTFGNYYSNIMWRDVTDTFQEGKTDQKTVLYKIVEESCSNKNETLKEQCYSKGHEIADRLQTPDPVAFGKNEASLIVGTCSIFNDQNDNADQLECLMKGINAKQESSTDSMDDLVLSTAAVRIQTSYLVERSKELKNHQLPPATVVYNTNMNTVTDLKKLLLEYRQP